MTKKKKYHFGSEVYGEVYDWNKVFKLYESLGIPDDIYRVPREALKSKYAVLLSMRSVGKTSNVLLLGLCLRALYEGVQVCYVRRTADEFTPTEAKKLVNVLNTFNEGAYIKKLTGGRFNTIIYKARAFYYARVEDGEIIEKEQEECIKALISERWAEYKSGLNMPKGDFFLFDEFIGDRYLPDEFVHFCDLFKTVARERLSPVIFMLANTISPVSPYFSELEVRPYIRTLRQGEHISVKTERDTSIYVELCNIGKKAQEKRAFFNSIFLGFKNEKLGAITGGNLWALPNVPHIYRREAGADVEYLARNIYLKVEDEFLRIDLVNDEEAGYHGEVMRAKEPREDAVILTLEMPTDARELYLLGGRKRKIRGLLLDLINDGKLFYATNEEGTLFKHFITRALELERMPLM